MDESWCKILEEARASSCLIVATALKGMCIEELSISSEGVQKQLNNLKVGKALGRT